MTCKHGEGDIRKHNLGLAVGVTYFLLQEEPAQVSVYQTRVSFNPQGFIPDIDFRGSVEELIDPTRPDTHGQSIPEQDGAPIVVKDAPVVTPQEINPAVPAIIMMPQ